MQTAEERDQRLHLDDMLTAAQAAMQIGVGEDYLRVLIEKRAVFALVDSDCVPYLPSWALDRSVWHSLPTVRECITDPWEMLEFFETARADLARMAPLQAIMQGMVDSEWVRSMAQEWAKRKKS